MKHTLKRLTALVLVLSMALSTLSATAWAAETEQESHVHHETVLLEEEQPETVVEETEAESAAPEEAPDEEEVLTVEAVSETEEETEEPTEDTAGGAAPVEETVTEENGVTYHDLGWVDLGTTVTSAPKKKNALLNAASGNPTLKSGHYANWIDRVQLTNYARKLYDQMVEASDNDGTADWLIDPTEGMLLSGSYVVELDQLTGTAEGYASMEEAINARLLEVRQNVRAAFDAFDRDHPEVFWLSGSTSLSYGYYDMGDGSYLMVSYFALQRSSFDVRESSYRNPERIRSDIAKREEYISSILSGATGTTAEKVTYFNKWLTKNNGYNTTLLNSGSAGAAAHECLVALAGTHGANGPVCEGYARAFKVLCDRANIPCTLVDGEAINSSGRAESHMWNYVQVYGKWYGMDVTWNDPVVNGQDTDGRTTYLMVGAATVAGRGAFINTHPITNRASVNGIGFTNGPVLEEERLPANATCTHNPVPLPAVKASCTEAGLTAGSKCSLCDEILIAQQIDDAKGHTSMPLPVVEATCTTPGMTAGAKCSVCSEILTQPQETEPAKGHIAAEEGIITQQPTYTAGGKLVYPCVVCSEEARSEVIPKRVKGANTITATITAKTYSTKKQTLSIGIKVEGSAKVTYGKPSDKKITSDGKGKLTIPAKYMGKFTVTVTAAECASYQKTSKTITFTVNPTKTTISKAANVKGSKMQVKWKKNAVGTGYEVQYSTDKSFKTGVKTVTVKKNSATSANIAKLVKGKTYYARVRTYKTVGKNKLVSGWSSVKSAKISK